MAEPTKTPNPRRRGATDKKKLEEAAATAAEKPVELPDDKPIPGVFVARVPVPGKPNESQVQVVPMNGFDILAVDSLLRLGIKVNNERLGLT